MSAQPTPQARTIDLTGTEFSLDAAGQASLALADSALQAEADTLQTVATRGATVVGTPVTFDSANAGTNTYGGYLSVLGSRVESGSGSTASGTHSHAEGLNTTALGEYSHSEGNGTTASNTFSHAEGRTRWRLGCRATPKD